MTVVGEFFIEAGSAASLPATGAALVALRDEVDSEREFYAFEFNLTKIINKVTWGGGFRLCFSDTLKSYSKRYSNPKITMVTLM